MDLDEAIAQMTEHLQEKCGDNPISAVTILVRPSDRGDAHGLTAHYSRADRSWHIKRGTVETVNMYSRYMRRIAFLYDQARQQANGDV
jgi:hypothetical protein